MVPAATASPAGRMPGELRSRHLLIRVAEITAVIALVALAITALPGLDEVRRRLQGADPAWVVAIAVAELGSCAGYVLVFRSTFCSQMPWGLTYDIAMAELAANSLCRLAGPGVSRSASGLSARPGCPPITSRGARSRSSSSQAPRTPRARSGGPRRVRRYRGRPGVRGVDACAGADHRAGDTAGRNQPAPPAGVGASWRGRRHRSLAWTRAPGSAQRAGRRRRRCR